MSVNTDRLRKTKTLKAHFYQPIEAPALVVALKNLLEEVPADAVSRATFIVSADRGEEDWGEYAQKVTHTLAWREWETDDERNARVQRAVKLEETQKRYTEERERAQLARLKAKYEGAQNT